MYYQRYARGENHTSSGRVSRPSRKVQELLAESMIKGFLAIYTDTICRSKDIDRMIRNKETGQELQDAISHWQGVRDQLYTFYRDAEKTLEPRDYALCQKDMADLYPYLDNLDTTIAKILPESDSASLAESYESKKAALESEISWLEEQYQKTMSEFGSQRSTSPSPCRSTGTRKSPRADGGKKPASPRLSRLDHYLEKSEGEVKPKALVRTVINRPVVKDPPPAVIRADVVLQIIAEMNKGVIRTRYGTEGTDNLTSPPRSASAEDGGRRDSNRKPQFVLRDTERNQPAPREIKYKPERDSPPHEQIRYKGDYIASPPDQSSPGRLTEKTILKMADALMRDRETATLPRVEPPMFGGDPLMFSTWWNTFRIMIEARVSCDRRKLLYLYQYTKGEVRSVVEGYMNMADGEPAYERAKTAVHNRFGNRLILADGYKQKLSRWPRIRDGDGRGLAALSDFLWQCHHVMQGSVNLDVLHTQEEISRIAAKLPHSLQMRWHRKVDSLIYGGSVRDFQDAAAVQGEFPRFEEFCKFLAGEARVATGPCSSLAPPTQPGRAEGRTLFTDTPRTPRSQSADARAPRCSYCKGEHHLYRCDEFLQQPSTDRREYALRRGLCFGCLRRGHRSRECTIRNSSLMAPLPGEAPLPAPENATAGPHRHPEADPPSTAKGVVCKASVPRGQMYTYVVPVLLYHPDRPEEAVTTYAAVDNQSNCTFVSKRLFQRMKLAGEEVDLELTTMGQTEVETCHRIAELHVRGVKEKEVMGIYGSYTRDHIPISLDCIPKDDVIARHEHLKPIRSMIRHPVAGDAVEILIGYDCGRALLPKESLYTDTSGLFAVRFTLGWSVTGNEDEGRARLSHCFRTSAREVTHRDLVKAFDADFVYNEKEDNGVKVSADDKKFLQIVTEGIKQSKEDKKFEMPLPFREIPSNLPPSRGPAVHKLRQTGKKMKKHESYGHRYRESMNKLIKSDQSERVPCPDERDPETVWYWSHHGVDHHRKDKLRCVFNGSAKIRGVALNDLLLTGPDLTNSLAGVLLRFRLKLIAILCDIGGMFHQVRITPWFRDFVRFVWFEDGDPDKPIVDFRMTVHLFGASSSPGCANFALKETARRFEEQFGKEAADFLRDNFYVDDGLGGQDTVEGAIKLIYDSHRMCAEGGFRLCKFDSSSEEVVKSIPEDWRAKNPETVPLVAATENAEEDEAENHESDYALGVGINLKKDAFVYRFTPKDLRNTRRGYLSGLSSVYDPLGLIGPAILPGRIILQKLCAERLDWDDELEDEVVKTWGEWYQQLKDINKIVIDRCVKKNLKGEITKIELHVFVDASVLGYGICIYLVLRTRAQFQSSLLFGKSKVAPLKPVTMPRMELQAAVLGVQAWSFVEMELKLTGVESHFYSDSKITLAYIGNLALRCHMYVNNRASYIRTKTRPNQWKYVQTSENPADLASRGVTAQELVDSDLWWHGPGFLSEPAVPCSESFPLSPDDPEVKKGQSENRCLLTAINRPAADNTSLVEQIARRHSTWEALLGVFVKFTEVFLKARRVTATEAEKRQLAEELIWRNVQRAAMPLEYTRLKDTTLESLAERTSSRDTKVKQIPKSSPIYPLNPYMGEDRLLRVGGRLNRGDYPERFKHPIILPSKSAAVKLKILDTHQKSGHPGANWTLGATRSAGLWIVKGKSAVNRLLSACVKCIRMRKPAMVQQMSTLPQERLAEVEPFTYSAVDLFGPFSIKFSSRSVKKRWVAIFVCLACRGIHMEVTDSLDTSSYLLAYRRFTNRRGPIRALYSDRGTNFVGGSNEVEAERALITSDDVRREMAKNGCDMVDFRFNAPKASHMGGAWERMIRTVRAAMCHTLTVHPESLTDDQFHTVITETEALVNSRPVSYVDSTGGEDPQPLSPAQLLTLKTHITPPLPGVFPDTARYARKRWKYVQYLAGQFWDRWRVEITPKQQARQKWCKKAPSANVGDVVIMMEEDQVRGRWPLARVTEAQPDDDGQVRRVKIRVKGSTLERPIHKLIRVLDAEEEAMRVTAETRNLRPRRDAQAPTDSKSDVR